MLATFTKLICTAATASLILSSCGSSESFSMASEEGIAKIHELIETHIDTTKNKIYQVKWSEDAGDRKLENILSQIDVYYTDSDNNDYTLTFALTDGKFTTDGPVKSKRQFNSYECSTPLDLSAISFEFIKKISEAAIGIVEAEEGGEELELKSVEKYDFRVWPVALRVADRWKENAEFSQESKIMEVKFEFNYVKKGENPTYEGRFTTVNYYTIPFSANADGEVTLEE